MDTEWHRCAMMVLLAGLCGSGWTAEPLTAELLSTPFVEVYQPEVQVSGHVIVGVMSAAAQSALAHDRLAVSPAMLPDRTEVCVRATSNDGIYSSENHYRLPAAARPVQLPYRSGKVDVITGYAAGDIAVSVTLGDCAEKAVGTYLVASGLAADPADPLLVFLNSFGATDVFLEVLGGGDLIPCQYLSEGRRTTYDFLCTVAASAGADGGVREITIIRERFGREQPSLTFRVAGPAQ